MSIEAVRRAFADHVGAQTAGVVMSIADRLIEQGHAKGKQEGMRDALLRVLAGRFGPLPDPVVEKVRSATVDQLDAWIGRAGTAPSPEDALDA